MKLDIELSKEVQAEVDFCVRYGTLLDIDNCLMRIKQRYLYNSKAKKRKPVNSERLRTWFRGYLEMVERRYPPFPNSRCPDCGAKLSARRCLYCDMKNGRAHKDFNFTEDK